MFGSLSGFAGTFTFRAPPPAGHVHPQCHMIYSSTTVNPRHISRNPRKNAVSPNPPVLVSQILYLAQSLRYKHILKRQHGSLSIREQYRFPLSFVFCARYAFRGRPRLSHIDGHSQNEKIFGEKEYDYTRGTEKSNRGRISYS